MNFKLTRNYTKNELKEALNQMGPLKSPGPNGFSAGFFQTHWDIVDDAVSEVVLFILQGGGMNYSLNSTFIALIPKANNPSLVSEFRPISFFNVLYKLVSKVITNRLKYVMSFVMSDNQSFFIPSRLIIDNIILAHKLLHSMKGKKT